MKKTIKIAEIDTRKVIKEIDVSKQSERSIERILSAITHQSNQEKYFVYQ